MRRAAAGVAVLVLALAAGTALDTALYDAAGPADAPAEAAVVLGAAVWGDQPSPVFAARLDHAASLYHEGRVPRILLTGGSREPGVPAEADVGRAYLRGLGVPDTAMAGERRSRTTWQNLACVRPLVDGPVLLVSDPLHLRRAVQLAEDLAIDAAPSATPTTRYRGVRARATFLARETWFRLVGGTGRALGSLDCPPEG